MADSLDQHRITMKPWHAILMLAMAYAGIGMIVLQLALPPGYATVIFPSAGIALAAIMIAGPRLLPGVALGAFMLNAIQGLHNPELALLPAVLAAATIAAGSTLQAWGGAWLLRRWIRPALDTGRDVLLFLLAAPLSCLIAASIAVAGLALLGLMMTGELLLNWLTWWAGDTVGSCWARPWHGS